MAQRPRSDSATFILFGATGDLAVKKIFPALDRLSDHSLRVIAVSRRDWSADDLRAFLRESGLKLSPRFEEGLSYAKVDVDADAGYDALRSEVERLGGEPLVYLSLAPQLHGRAFESLVKSGVIARGRGKILIEKPFGTDEKSAKALDELILSEIHEDQLLRVDHYLGKETVLALMDLHESTPDFDRMISAETVSSIRARMLETRGIGGRGASYDPVGAFRDVGQNHLLEMLSVVAADISSGLSWQEARAEVIELLAPPANTCELSRRGQYEGYRSEKGVVSDSKTETAFEVVTSLSKGKLAGVPLILEAGKMMGRSEAWVEIAFQEVPGLPRRMVFFIQPDQKIVIEYREGAPDIYEIPKRRDAYENVIDAALRGSKREFVGRREIEALWRYADHVVACWGKVPLEEYSAEKPFVFGSPASDF